MPKKTKERILFLLLEVLRDSSKWFINWSNSSVQRNLKENFQKKAKS